MESQHVEQLTRARELLRNGAPQTSLAVVTETLPDLSGTDRDRAIVVYASVLDELMPPAILTRALFVAHAHLEAGLRIATPSDPDARDYHTRTILEHGARYQGLLGLSQIPRFERSATQDDIRALERQLVSFAFSIRDWGAANQAPLFHEASERYWAAARANENEHAIRTQPPLVHRLRNLAKQYDSLRSHVPRAA